MPDYAGWLSQTVNVFKNIKVANRAKWYTVTSKPSKFLLKNIDVVPVVRNGDKRCFPILLKKLLFTIKTFKLINQGGMSNSVIYVPNAYYPIEIIVLLAKVFKVPSVVRVCHNELSHNNLAVMIRRSIIIKYASTVIALNNKVFKDIGVKKSGKVAFIPNGVNTSRFYQFSEQEKLKLRDKYNIPYGELVVLYVGSIVERKGVEDLMVDYIEFRRTTKNSLLLLAGPYDTSSKEVDSKYITKLYDIVRNSGESDSIKFLGNVQNIEELYNVADIFVLPSKSEGMPNVLLEAMSSGLTCIASNIPGVRDIVSDGYNGLLIENETRGILTKLLDLSKDKQKRKHLGDNARATILKSYSVEVQAKAYNSLFRSIQ